MIEISASQVEYIKAIYSLKDKTSVTSIANYLNYSKPSVVRALKNLKELNLITYEQKLIKLTDIGIKYAKNIIRKDDILQRFFIDVLEITPEIAIKDAENIKHAVSCYTISKLEQYVNKVLGEDPKKYEDK